MNKYLKYLIPVLIFLLIIVLTSCQSKEIRELETKIILLEEENNKLKKELEERPVKEIIMESAPEEYEFEGKEISGEELMEKANELSEELKEKDKRINELEAEVDRLKSELLGEKGTTAKVEEEKEEVTKGTEKTESSVNGSNQPIIVSASDSLGNTNTNSWAKGTGGDWPSGGLDASPTIYIGDTITFTINVKNSTDLLYKFDYQPPGGSFITIQGWSNSNVCTWTVPKNAFGKWMCVMVQVKNNDGLNFLGSCDDYTYLTYIVLNR